MKILLALCLMCLSHAASADIQFEGYFRIERDGRAIGYMIHRVEHRPSQNQRIISTYIRRRRGEVENYTFTRSVVKNDFTPVSYYFRADDHNLDQYSKAEFSGSKIQVDTFDAKGKKIASAIETPPKGAFLSAFTNYLLPPAKMELGKDYDYLAFTEEFGRYQRGELFLKETKSVAGQTVYQTFDDVSGETIESFMFGNGDPLGSRSLAGDVVAYLVSSRTEAVQGFDEFPQKHVIEFFKDLPEGKKNPVVTSRGKLKPFEIISSFSSAAKQARSANQRDSRNVTLKLPVKGL